MECVSTKPTSIQYISIVVKSRTAFSCRRKSLSHDALCFKCSGCGGLSDMKEVLTWSSVKWGIRRTIAWPDKKSPCQINKCLVRPTKGLSWFWVLTEPLAACRGPSASLRVCASGGRTNSCGTLVGSVSSGNRTCLREACKQEWHPCWLSAKHLRYRDFVLGIILFLELFTVWPSVSVRISVAVSNLCVSRERAHFGEIPALCPPRDSRPVELTAPVERGHQ